MSSEWGCIVSQWHERKYSTTVMTNNIWWCILAMAFRHSLYSLTYPPPLPPLSLPLLAAHVHIVFNLTLTSGSDKLWMMLLYLASICVTDCTSTKSFSCKCVKMPFYLSMKYALKMPLLQFKFGFWIFISSGLIFFPLTLSRCAYVCVFFRHLFTQ